MKSLGTTDMFSNLISNLPSDAAKTVAKTSPHIPEGEPYQPSAPAQTQTNADTFKIVMAALQAAGVINPTQAAGLAISQTIEIPKSAARPVFQDNSITSYDELMAELSNVNGVNEPIKLPTDRKLTPKEAEDILSRMPRLRRKAFIRNKVQSQFMISDLYTSFDGGGPCLTMLPGAAYDLARIPARNILNSTDLKWAFETGKIELVNGSVYAACFKKINDEMTALAASPLKVYDSHEDVGGMPDEGSIHVGGASSFVPKEGEIEAPPSSIDDPDIARVVNSMPTERTQGSVSKTPRRI
jgi:hypothetical protein